jgi:hypothetical protein
VEAFIKAMPDVGFDWAKNIGGPSVLLYETSLYAGQVEALATRWAVGDTSRLQPAMGAACWYAFTLFANLLKKTAGQSEMELLGRSGAISLVEGTSVTMSIFATSRDTPDET